MFKLTVLLYRFWYITFLIFLLITDIILKFLPFLNQNIAIILQALMPFILTIYSTLICTGYPKKTFKKSCDIQTYKSHLTILKKYLRSDTERNILKEEECLCKFFSEGPSNEIETYVLNILNKSNNKKSINYYNILYLIYLEKKDSSSLQKCYNEFINQHTILKKFGKNVTELSFYKLVFNNDNFQEKNILKALNTKKINKLEKTISYYVLSLYCKQNNKIKEEKEYLEKVVKFGNNTYMAKNAQQWLKNLGKND